MLQWQYKSVLISEKTTAGELVDILFRFTTKNLDDVHFYMLHLVSLIKITHMSPYILDNHGF